MFDWFETHSLGSRHRGAGLGLSIVRSFVELHGGTVTLDSTVGRGTTVVCTFPLNRDADRRKRAAGERGVRCQRCRFNWTLPELGLRRFRANSGRLVGHLH